MELSIKSNIFDGITYSGDTIYFKTYLAGEWYSSEKWYDIKSPIDLSLLARVPRIPEAKINEVVSLINEKGKWEMRDTPGEKRLRTYHRASELLEEFKDDFIEVLMKNNGKTKSTARGEVEASIERLGRADMDVRKLYGEYVPGDWSSETLETEAIIRREPMGVVMAIIPFNYPLFDTVNKLVYSTVAGNSLIIKTPSFTPLPIIMFAKLIEMSGFPRHSLAVITNTSRELGNLIMDKRISVISLTGSSETGEKVIGQGGIKQYIMELGGGDVALVLEDSDIDWAAKRIATGIYSYTGQRCDSIKLILAENGIYDKLKGKIIEELTRVKVGDPREDVTIGPLIDESAADEFEASIKDSIRKGGRILFGGQRIGRNYVIPTIIEVERANIKEFLLYNKEVFAPISLMTRVSNLDEMIELANGRKYGLDVAIFGKDINKIRRLARFLEVGAVYINDYPRHGIGYFPFGGRKDSGIGREGIGYTIEYVTTYKTIVYNYKGKGIWEYL